MEIELREYQAWVRDNSRFYADTREYVTIGLAGEVGEYLNVVKKMMRNPELDNREQRILELGDVLYYFVRCAIHDGITLEEIASRNVDKLTERYREQDYPDSECLTTPDGSCVSPYCKLHGGTLEKDATR